MTFKSKAQGERQEEIKAAAEEDALDLQAPKAAKVFAVEAFAELPLCKLLQQAL